MGVRIFKILWYFCEMKYGMIWAAVWKKQLNVMCAQRRLRSAWASAQSGQSLLCAQWVARDPSFIHADSEDSDQTGQMPRLIWVFAGRTVISFVLSSMGIIFTYHCFIIFVRFRIDTDNHPHSPVTFKVVLEQMGQLGVSVWYHLQHRTKLMSHRCRKGISWMDELWF